MSDSEKMDLILLDMREMKADIQGLKTDMRGMNIRMDGLESQIKETERNLRNEIRKECALVLDEVERVHIILERHKADKSVHTA